MTTAATHVVAYDELRTWCERLLRDLGQSEENAVTGAEVLVRTTARGFRSHGVELLPMYAGWMRSGAIRGDARPETVLDSGAVAVVDGHGAMGQITGVAAVSEACARARIHGVGLVTVRGGNHLGALGHYALLAAEAGAVALVWSSAPPTIHAPGGRTRLIGNGPIAFGAPRDGQQPLVFDAAMSIGSGGKAALARTRGEQIPVDWLLDAEGRPTTDPAEAPAGSFVPLGGHKGFALALLAELLSTGLSGARSSAELPALAPPPSEPFGMGHAVLAVDPAAFGGDFASRAADLSDLIRASPTAPGSAAVLTPGDGAHERERVARRDGILFDAATWERLEGLRGAR